MEYYRLRVENEKHELFVFIKGPTIVTAFAELMIGELRDQVLAFFPKDMPVSLSLFGITVITQEEYEREIHGPDGAVQKNLM